MHAPPNSVLLKGRKHVKVACGQEMVMHSHGHNKEPEEGRTYILERPSERLQRRTDSSLRETQDEEALSLKELG